MLVVLIAAGRNVDPPFILDCEPAGTREREHHVCTTNRFGNHASPYYRPLTYPSSTTERDLGDPGSFPFTRGTRTTGYQAKKWDRSPGDGPRHRRRDERAAPPPASAKDRRHQLDGLGYAPFESSDPKAAALVGRGGVWVDTLADMEDVFREIPIESLSINQTGNSIPAFAMIVGARAGAASRSRSSRHDPELTCCRGVSRRATTATTTST